MGKPETVEAYLAEVPADQRAALERLRGQIRRAAPDATETISYGMPTFKDQGRMLVSYAAFKDHCSLFPATGTIQETLGGEVEPYLAGKGTLRFTPKEPLPAALVTKIVKIRLAENAEHRGKRAR